MNQSGQPSTSAGANFVILLGLVTGIFIVFWIWSREYLVIPVFWIRNVEIDVIRFFLPFFQLMSRFLHLSFWTDRQLNALQLYMHTINPNKITWTKFATINLTIGDIVRYPFMIILCGLAVLTYFSKSSQFRHQYNMKTLRVVGQEVWPQITPIISLDLIKENIDKGPWAMAKPPLNFCQEHHLLGVKTVAGKKIWIINQKPAYRLFALQLGPLWKGLESLPIHMKALALIFLGRATGERPMTNTILSQIAASAATGKLDFSTVSEKLTAYKDHRIILWLEKRHAYVFTLLASLLEISRSDGVLACSEFLWLKPVDRRLWYMLNNVGRATAFVEIAGAFSHWKAEKKIGRALKTPMVKGAVDALDETLQNILLVEEGDLWHTTNED